MRMSFRAYELANCGDWIRTKETSVAKRRIDMSVHPVIDEFNNPFASLHKDPQTSQNQHPRP